MNATPKAPSTALVRVLLVEDDPSDHRLVIDLLDQVPATRFLIDWAQSLADGLDRIKHATFDICLLDLRLPDGDGLDLASAADTLGLSLPIIVLSGFPSIEPDRRALALGATGFLEKDKLDPLTLERAIRYAVHQRKIATNIARQAFVDERTGLISPALYRERLDRALAFAKRRDRELAVMMIDLAFDPSQAAGEDQTDAVLAAAGRALAGALRETDSIARLSDRRLVLLIEGMRNLDHAATVARKTLRLLRAPIDVEGRTIAIAPSIGIAIYPHVGGHGDALMREAEAAMRRAMEENAGNCRFSSERIDHEAREGIILEKAFTLAFEHRELRLRFHPEVRRSGRPAGPADSAGLADHARPADRAGPAGLGGPAGRVGLAGLAFWRHPDRGWLPMDRTLANTEDEALIKGIANWSLAAAAEQLLAWQRDGLRPARLSLAFPFLRRPALAFLRQAVEEQVVSRKVAPDHIELDLQEDLVLEDAQRGCSDLAKLKATGVRLTLDGFGAGKAAIQDLRHDLLDGLKLAPELHQDLPGIAWKETLLRALINLGHNLGLEVSARDAHDQRLFALLKRLGCDVIQLTALPPMSADAATAWLQTLGSGALHPRPGPEVLVPKGRPPNQAPAKAPPTATRD